VAHYDKVHGPIIIGPANWQVSAAPR